MPRQPPGVTVSGMRNVPDHDLGVAFVDRDIGRAMAITAPITVGAAAATTRCGTGLTISTEYDGRLEHGVPCRRFAVRAVLRASHAAR